MPKKENKNYLQTIKGTRDLIGNDFLSLQGFIEKASEIALYYGFRPIETPIIEYESLFLRGIGESSDIVRKELYTLKTKGGSKLALRPEGTAGVMRSYLEKGMHSLPQPQMFYYSGPFFRHEKPQRGRWREFWSFGLEILGSKKSVADASIIKLTSIILHEVGIENALISINNIGCPNCRSSFRRELVNYYRKNSKNICANCRQRLKTNPIRVLDCKADRCQIIKRGAPETLSYLCAECKKHFKEVMEYLDNSNVPYKIDNNLVRGLDYYNRTVFEIILPEGYKKEGEGIIDESTPALALAGGGRYDGLSKILGSKREVPAVGVGIGIDRLLEIIDRKKVQPRIIKKPKVFFIQLGFEAKLKSFEIIEILRQAKIPTIYSLSKDTLSAQLAQAEKSSVPIVIILGQKEALEDSVIIRNMDNRSQETVPIIKLLEKIKKI
ncbi:MAG TPA: histidine--tRNA ligase [Candidatus Atribacteria bacterium]|nr:histidine--tRNA ligase [Candidatus Atribacteria bacterium]